MHIVLFTDTLGDVNGVSRFIRNAATQALATGRDLTVVTSTRMALPQQPNILNVAPLFATAMPKYPQLELAIPRSGPMRSLATRLRPTVVHVSTPGPVGTFGRRFALKNRLPLLGTYHTDFPAYIDHLFDHEPLTLASTAFMKWFYRPFRTIFSRSADYAERVHHLGIPRDRLKRLQPGIDLATFSTTFAPHNPEARAAFWSAYPGIRSDSIKCLYAGRVSVEKNLPLLAEAWPEIGRRAASLSIDAQLIIIGDGPYRAAMQSALRAEAAHPSAVFLGFKHSAELSHLYAASDLFLFPSRTDTLGQVVMEAQASGLPVLVTPDGGPREVVLEGTSGHVIPATPEAWIRATLDLITNTAKRRAMSQAAHDSMQKYTFAASFEDFWATHARFSPQP